MAADIGAVRDALRTRLANLADPLVAYGRATGQEQLPRSIVIMPVPPRTDHGGFWIAAPAGAIQYDFVLEIWVGLGIDVLHAQSVMDAYLSPAGTNASSIEGNLEDRSIDDDLADLTSSVRVDAFTIYTYGGLNTEGDQINALYAAVPVQVYVPG